MFMACCSNALVLPATVLIKPITLVRTQQHRSQHCSFQELPCVAAASASQQAAGAPHGMAELADCGSLGCGLHLAFSGNIIIQS